MDSRLLQSRVRDGVLFLGGAYIVTSTLALAHVVFFSVGDFPGADGFRLVRPVLTWATMASLTQSPGHYAANKGRANVKNASTAWSILDRDHRSRRRIDPNFAVYQGKLLAFGALRKRIMYRANRILGCSGINFISAVVTAGSSLEVSWGNKTALDRLSRGRTTHASRYIKVSSFPLFTRTLINYVVFSIRFG